MMNDLKAKEIMTVDVKTVKKDDTVSDVAKMLIQDKIGGLPVVDEDNKVIGIISETDILKKEKYIEPPRVINFLQGLIFLDDMKNLEKDLKRIAAYKVEDLMTEDIVTVHEDDKFDDVANVMIKKSINRVPVVDDDTDECFCHYFFWRINQKNNVNKSSIAFYTFAGSICWT